MARAQNKPNHPAITGSRAHGLRAHGLTGSRACGLDIAGLSSTGLLLVVVVIGDDR